MSTWIGMGQVDWVELVFSPKPLGIITNITLENTAAERGLMGDIYCALRKIGRAHV